jgi:hypothetical protein
VGVSPDRTPANIGCRGRTNQAEFCTFADCSRSTGYGGWVGECKRNEITRAMVHARDPGGKGERRAGRCRALPPPTCPRSLLPTASPHRLTAMCSSTRSHNMAAHETLAPCSIQNCHDVYCQCSLPAADVSMRVGSMRRSRLPTCAHEVINSKQQSMEVDGPRIRSSFPNTGLTVRGGRSWRCSGVLGSDTPLCGRRAYSACPLVARTMPPSTSVQASCRVLSRSSIESQHLRAAVRRRLFLSINTHLVSFDENALPPSSDYG